MCLEARAACHVCSQCRSAHRGWAPPTAVWITQTHETVGLEEENLYIYVYIIYIYIYIYMKFVLFMGWHVGWPPPHRRLNS
jgi:hypothetical protein